MPALCIILDKFSSREHKNIFFISCEGAKYVENLTGVILNPDMLLFTCNGHWNVPRRCSLFAMAANGTNHIVEKKIFLSTFVQAVTVTPTLFVNIYFLNSISPRLPKSKN